MEWDYIVVGGGSAGCVLANRLSADADCRVLLIEAGGADNHPLYSIPAGFARMTKGLGSWGWQTVPQRHLNGRIFNFTQAKVIGGGSTINAQVYTRGNALDFDRWAHDEGCAGWSHEDVLPYFRRSERNSRLNDRFHSQDGELAVSDPIATLPVCEAFLESAQQAGLPRNEDINGASQHGVGYYQLTQSDGRRCSAKTAFLNPVSARKNLEIRLNCSIGRVIVENGRARGVEALSDGRTETLNAAREVILASGTVGSPKILLQSGIGPADELRALGIDVALDLPGVGKNLQDHIDLFTIWECSGNHSYDSYARLDRTLIAGIRYLLTRSGPAASSLFETGGFAFVDSAAPSPDIQLHFGQGSGIESGVVKLNNPGVTLNSALMRPQSRGTVRLASNDPTSAPLIDPNYWAESKDRHISLEGLKLAREIMSQPALSEYLNREVLPGPDVKKAEQLAAYATGSAKTDHHPVGTCKMGVDPMAVVTPDLAVHGIMGMRICDASIMPSIISSNTNATAIMIAEKGADHILGRISQ